MQHSFQVSCSKGEAPVAASLFEHQRTFAEAVLDPSLPVPPDLVGPDGCLSARRFAVYRNNVMSGLIDALRSGFPAVARLVGDEFFQAMARVFVARTLPATPIMLEYGATFPAFISRFEPARTVPYLGDIARLERAWLEAYHAPEALPLAADGLDPLDGRALASGRCILHPSARIVSSPFPIVTLWQMNVGDGKPAPMNENWVGESALVVRPNSSVEVRRVSDDAARLVEELAGGATVGDATMQVFGIDHQVDAGSVIDCLVEAGLMVGFEPGAVSSRPPAVDCL